MVLYLVLSRLLLLCIGSQKCLYSWVTSPQELIGNSRRSNWKITLQYHAYAILPFFFHDHNYIIFLISKRSTQIWEKGKKWIWAEWQSVTVQLLRQQVLSNESWWAFIISLSVFSLSYSLSVPWLNSLHFSQ